MSWIKIQDLSTGKIILDTRRDDLPEDDQKYFTQLDTLFDGIKNPKAQQNADKLREAAVKNAIKDQARRDAGLED